MEVDMDSCEWRWCSSSSSSHGTEEEAGDDTKDSIASTIVDGESSGSGSGSSSCCAHLDVLERFHQLVQQRMECSVLMPSSSCCSLQLPEAWQLHMDGEAAEAAAPAIDASNGDYPLAQTLQKMKLLDNAVSRAILPAKSAAARKQHHHRGILSSPLSCSDTLWKRLLFESKGLQWLRSALGGDEAVRRMFCNAYLNIQSISKPAEVAEAASKKGCAPWALVQVAESDACVCCLSLMRTPFAGFKRHSRNGVVFCFFGSRAFVSCMDDECRRVLRRQSKAFFCLAREAEEIHLGRYDGLITLDRDEFLPSILAQSAFARSLVEEERGCGCRGLLEREARKRWNRVLMQGPPGNIHWMQQQVQRIQSGLLVTGCHEADQGSMADLTFVRRTPSRCMCNSASEDRTWVELQEETVRAYSSWLLKRSSRDGQAPVDAAAAESSSSLQEEKNEKKGKKRAAPCGKSLKNHHRAKKQFALLRKGL